MQLVNESWKEEGSKSVKLFETICLSMIYISIEFPGQTITLAVVTYIAMAIKIIKLLGQIVLLVS